MHLIVKLAGDDIEVTYEIDSLTISHDPYGISGHLPGCNRRPEGDYLTATGARVVDIQGAETGYWAEPS